MNQPSLITKSKEAIKATLVFKTLGQALGLLATILIVSALSEMEYGIYNLLYTVISLLYLVASLGLNNALQRYIPEYYHKGEFRFAHTLYRTFTILRLITNILIIGLLLIFWDAIAPFIKLGEHKNYFMLFILIIFISMQREMLEKCLASFFLQKYSKPIGCLFSATRVIGYGMIIIFDKDLWYAIATDLAANAIVFTLLQILYYKKIPVSQSTKAPFPKAEARRVYKYALFYNFNDTGDGLLNSYFDNIIIAIYLNPIAVGAYSFCVTMTVMIGSLLPIRYFKDIIHASFFSLGASSGQQKILSFFQMIVKWHCVFTIPCFFFLVLFSDDIILLFFNGKFIEYAMVLCCIFFFFEVLSFPFAMVAQFKEKARIILLSKIFALYNLIADIILIKFFGIWGAAIATGTAVFGKNMFIWYFVKEDAHFKGMEKFFCKLLLFWAIATAIFYQIDLILYLVYVKLGVALICLFIFFLLQFRCGLFNKEEMNVLGLFSEKNSRLRFIFESLQLIKRGEAQ